MTKSASTQKLFHSVVVPSKPPIKKINICYYESRSLKIEIRLTWEKTNQF